MNCSHSDVALNCKLDIPYSQACLPGVLSLTPALPGFFVLSLWYGVTVLFIILDFVDFKLQHRHYDYTTSEYFVKNGMPPWEFNLNTY